VLNCTATGEQPWNLHEFYVDGIAHPVDDPAARQVANAGARLPRDERFVLFELDVTSAFSTIRPGRPTCPTTLARHPRHMTASPGLRSGTPRSPAADHAP
jgi:hypothetical protein